MPFVKLQKNKAYFKRYQVKYRRRRDGKTDYRARKRLVAQDKNKYAAHRYRLVVRLTSHYVICQIIYSEIDGDHVLVSAYSSELPRFGLKVGLKNYAAAYATGLLVARRALHKLGLEKSYKGNSKIDANIVKTTNTNDAGKTREYWVSEVADDRKPFRAVLDVGIRTTTTGARVFGALKGASDGGLDIPHNEKRFPGYNREEKKYDAEVHKARIFGGHIANYMRELESEDNDAYQREFAKFIASGIKADNLEALYASVHAKIRADPSAAPKSTYKPDAKFKKPAKKSLADRKAAIASKKLARLNQLRSQVAAAGADADEEDDE